jgi:hypothetical protein
LPLLEKGAPTNFVTGYNDKIMAARLISSYLLVVVLALLFGCSHQAVQKHSINAAYDVKVNDPQLRQLTDVTQNVDIVATGEFTPGTFVFKKTSVTFDPGTMFKLTVSLPIDDPSMIHTRDATGSLWTSQQIRVNGMPVPQTIDLNKGSVSVEVDLVRSLGAFFVALLQKGSDPKSGDPTDVHQILQALHINDATLNLRPDSYLNVDRQKVHIGPGSKIALEDVTVGSDLSYDGICHVYLKFLNGCQWASDKVRCQFDGGEADLHLAANRTADRLVLTVKKIKHQTSVITIKKGTFSFGKRQNSHAFSDSCVISPQEMRYEFWKNAARPHLHMTANMNIERTDLSVKTAAQETIAYFPETVPATLQIDEDDSGMLTQLATTEPAKVEHGRIIIAKKATSLTIWLTDAVIGPTSLDKSGAFQLALEHGVAHLKQLDWRGNTSKFTLVPSGNSDLSIPKGMLLENTGGNVPTQLKMPLNIDLGTATIKGPSGATTLTDLSGQLMINVDREVQIDGDLGFTLPQLKVLAGEPIDISAHGLDLEVVPGGPVLQLKKCKVIVPQGSVQSAINKKVPQTLTFTINKKVSEDEKWRYRHVMVQTVTIANLQLRHMKPIPPDSVSFNAVGDIELDGTVEQRDVKATGDLPSDWEVRPWSLTGRLDNDGLVRYKFITHNGPRESQVAYTLTMAVPVPSDVKLDWSRVAHGVLGFIERNVIVSHLKKITIPINYQGQVEIFPEGNILAKNFKVSKMVAKHTDDATELDFEANAHF